MRKQQKAVEVRHAEERNAAEARSLHNEMGKAERQLEGLERLEEQFIRAASHRAQRAQRGATQDLQQCAADIAAIQAQSRPIPTWLKADRKALEQRLAALQAQREELRLRQERREEIAALAAFPPTPVRDPSFLPQEQPQLLPMEKEEELSPLTGQLNMDLLGRYK